MASLGKLGSIKREESTSYAIELNLELALKGDKGFRGTIFCDKNGRM
jgi:hypothetical protein